MVLRRTELSPRQFPQAADDFSRIYNSPPWRTHLVSTTRGEQCSAISVSAGAELQQYFYKKEN
ncbi:hypothetical protein BgiMline_034796, partial [Biomphalaria glabrata]